MSCVGTRLVRWLPAAVTLVAAAVLAGQPLAAAEGELNAQGLQKIEGSRVDLAYERPGVVWSKYRTVQVLPLVIPPSMRVFDAAHDEEGETIPLSDEDAADLQQFCANVFRDELQREGFAVVTAPRSDTVVIAGEITSLVAIGPDVEAPHRSSSVAMKMVMTDGMTRTILGTSSGLKFARRLEETTPETNRAELRHAFWNWAHILAQDLHERVLAPKVDLWACLNERKSCPPGLLSSPDAGSR